MVTSMLVKDVGDRFVGAEFELLVIDSFNWKITNMTKNSHQHDDSATSILKLSSS